MLNNELWKLEDNEKPNIKTLWKLYEEMMNESTKEGK
jgi:hypothetical protein